MNYRLAITLRYTLYIVGTRARDGREIPPERVSCVVNGSRAAREKMTEEETESLEKGGGGRS